MDRLKGLVDASEGFRERARLQNRELFYGKVLDEMNREDPRGRTWTREALMKAARGRRKDDWLKA